jgi:hypothetical protein
MTPDIQRVLELAFPGEHARYFSPMAIGSTPATADEGAAAILDGIKTTTSSGFWDYPDGRIPFVGAYAFCWTDKAVCGRSSRQYESRLFRLGRSMKALPGPTAKVTER